MNMSLTPTNIADYGKIVDIKTASISHVCYVNNIPFISIRSITDTASHSGTEHFEIPIVLTVRKD